MACSWHCFHDFYHQMHLQDEENESQNEQNSLRGAPWATLWGHGGPRWGPMLIFWWFLMILVSFWGAFWGPFGEIFCIFCHEISMRFRTCFQIAFLNVWCHFGVPFGSICVHLGKLFDVIWRLFWPKDQKCKKCVWTAQACTDCMCDLPENYTFWRFWVF